MANERTEARRLGFARYRTGRPCARGHDAERFTSNGQCVECAKYLRVADRLDYRDARTRIATVRALIRPDDMADLEKVALTLGAQVPFSLLHKTAGASMYLISLPIENRMAMLAHANAAYDS